MDYKAIHPIVSSSIASIWQTNWNLSSCKSLKFRKLIAVLGLDFLKFGSVWSDYLIQNVRMSNAAQSFTYGYSTVQYSMYIHYSTSHPTSYYLEALQAWMITVQSLPCCTILDSKNNIINILFQWTFSFLGSNQPQEHQTTTLSCESFLS